MSVNPNTKLKSDLVQPIECVKANIVTLVTHDGLVTAKNLTLGQQVIIVIMSKRWCELETKNGIKHNKWLYDIIDINGNPLGWICAEWVWPEMVSYESAKRYGM